MSDETNDPAESPADEPAAATPPTRSVWDTSAPATPTEPAPEEDNGAAASNESAGMQNTTAGGATAEETDDAAAEPAEGAAGAAPGTAPDDVDVDDTEVGDGNWADEPVAGWAYQSVSTDAPPEDEAWDDEPEGEPAAEVEAEPESELEDPAAQRAALEAELDRQLAALGGDTDDDGVEHEDEYEDDEPLTPADEADTLVERLASDADDSDTAAATTTEAEAWAAPELTAVGDHADDLTSIAEAAVLAERKSRGPVVPLLVIGALIAAVIAAVVAVGGGDDKTDDATATTSASTVPFGSEAPASPDLVPMTAAEALEYFQVYGTQDPEALARMVALAAPDTPASYYALHQETLAQIDPQRNAPLNVTVEGEQVTACPQDPATGGCVTYSAFTKNAAGLITHFDIDGTPLRDRVAIGAGSLVTANGMQVSIISRYISVSDRLFIAYAVTNIGGTPLSPVSVRYITPSGDTVEPDQDTFRSAVPAGGAIRAAAAFPTTQAGGTIVVTSTADGGNSQQVAQVQTP